MWKIWANYWCMGLVALWVGKCPYGLPIAPSIGHSERHPVSKTSIDRIKNFFKNYFVDAFATHVCLISQRRYRGDGDRISTWFSCWAVHSSDCLHDENHQQRHLPLVKQLLGGRPTDCEQFENTVHWLYLGRSDVTALWSQHDRHFVGQHVVYTVCS